MSLKSLNDHESERRQSYTSRKGDKPRANGIACPECGEELMDSCPNIMLMSMPPKLNVHCPACDYCGYRIA